MSKRNYRAPKLKVHGTVKQLTQGIKDLGSPHDGDYLGVKAPGNEMTGSSVCIY